MNTIFAYFKVITLLFLILLMSHAISGQELEETDYNNDSALVKLAEVDYQLTLPVNNYKSALNKNLHGASIAYYWQRKQNFPQFLGVRLKYAFVDRVQGNVLDVVDGITVELDKVVSSNIASLSGAYRVYVEGDFWRFDPYVEAELGVAGYYSLESATIIDDQAGSDVSFLEFDLGIVYGVSAGTHILIKENTFFNFRAMFNGGSINSFNVEQDRQLAEPVENFDLKRSSTTAINLLLGFTIMF